MAGAPDHRGTRLPMEPPAAWDYAKLEALAGTDFRRMTAADNAYLQTWLQTTDREEIVARMTEWADKRDAAQAAASPLDRTASRLWVP